MAALAAQLDGAESGMKGICLRGLAGWGQVFAPLTTVVNTFGGTWFDENFDAQVDSPEFTAATQFYVDLVQQHGEPGAANAGFTECLNSFQQGGTAMWYDATSAAGSLEAEGSPVAGKVGYAPAPVKETDSAGWLYSWAWAIQESSDSKEAAWEFISWASSKEYEELVGTEIGWSSVPAGKRASTYENADYQESAAAFYEQTLASIEAADPTEPGRAAEAGAGHPVRRDPRVRRHGDRGVAGRERRHRRAADRPAGAGARAAAGADGRRRQQVGPHQRYGRRRRVRRAPPATRRPPRGVRPADSDPRRERRSRSRPRSPAGHPGRRKHP